MSSRPGDRRPERHGGPFPGRRRQGGADWCVRLLVKHLEVAANALGPEMERSDGLERRQQDGERDDRCNGVEEGNHQGGQDNRPNPQPDDCQGHAQVPAAGDGIPEGTKFV